MYLEHFKLNDAPFTITPNTFYFYKLAGHHEAFNTLVLHLRNGEGFIKVTGKVGSGKTLLCRLLLERLGHQFVTAYIPNPDLESLSLRKALAAELGVDKEHFSDPHQLLTAINEKLIQLHARGKKVVMLIDEAQALPRESLETLRLLTNLETQHAKLLQIVLFGQPELDRHLSQTGLRQLKQRIGFSSRLPALKYSELKQYIHHRLTMAGYKGLKPLFSKPALWVLFHKSKGVPRLINILAHKTLMSAYGRGAPKANFWDAIKAARDTESVTPEQNWLAVWLGLGLAAAALIFLLFWRI